MIEDPPVAGLHHFVFRRQIYPELQAVHHSFCSLRHLLVKDAAACGHPFILPGLIVPGVADMIVMLHRSAEHVGDRFDSRDGDARGNPFT